MRRQATARRAPARSATKQQTAGPARATARSQRPRANVETNVFARTMHFKVEKHSFGEHKKASLAAIKTKADKALLALSKRILEMPETTDIRTHDGHFRDWLNTVATPYADGVWLVGYDMVERVFAKAEAWEQERVRLVDVAADALPAQLELMRLRLEPGGLFNPRDYPSVARFKAHYWVRHRFINFGAPDALQEINATIFARERQKVEAESARAVTLIEQHLAGSLLKITEHLADLLQPRAGGKKPALRDSALDGLLTFLDTIALRDVTGFKELKAVTTRLRRTAEGLSVDDLRDNDDLRARTAAAVEEARDAVAALVIEDANPRAMRIRDDDEAVAS